MFKVILLYSLNFLFTFIIICYYFTFFNRIDDIFYKELQLLYFDNAIYRNFTNVINTKEINVIRQKSKYRKIGYGGHPIHYLFSLPIDQAIDIAPVIYSHSIELLAFIHSRPEEFYERLLSRKCKINSKDVIVIYTTSKSNDERINKKLKYESELYNDILQFNEISSYFNLSIQTINMIKWSCSISFNYLLKSDIDVFINIPLILYWIRKNKWKEKYYAMGKISKTFIIRDKKYSHYVPIEIIKENMFPPYLQGVGYIIPYSTVKLLLNSIEIVTPKIWIEDVYMGYMFKYNNVSLVDLSKYIIRDLPYNVSILFNNLNKYMLIHGLNPIEIYLLKEKNNYCNNHSLYILYIYNIYW